MGNFDDWWKAYQAWSMKPENAAQVCMYRPMNQLWARANVMLGLSYAEALDQWVRSPSYAVIEKASTTVSGYEHLAQVLQDAYAQASSGKGHERHANDLPFHEQPMQQIARRRGIGFILGQADKKSEEAQGMLDRCERDKAIHELLGAIVYLSGAVIYIRNQEQQP